VPPATAPASARYRLMFPGRPITTTPKSLVTAVNDFHASLSLFIAQYRRRITQERAARMSGFVRCSDHNAY
jgi:hypothetical protein